MSVPTLEELFTPLTRDQVLESELSIAQQLGMPVTAWQPVSIAREILYINAQMVANFSTTTSATARGGYLEYATGGWLTLLADQLFDVQRIESSSATGPILLTNTSTNPYTVTAGSVRVLNENNETTYTSTTGGTVNANGGTLQLDFVADVPGAASTLTETDVLSLVTSLPGVTPSWVSDLVGTDEETDSALRDRCRSSNARVSPNGPADAYRYYALTTTRPDGTSVGVTRTNVVQGNGTVTVYVADSDGIVVSQDVAYVQANLNENVTPTGFTVATYSAALKTISIDMTLVKSATATASNEELQELITAAISGYFSGVAVGGNKSLSFNGIYLSTLVTLARVACGESVVNVVITDPAVNVPLAANQVPVIDGSINFTWSNS
jgi:phage-related baseplate assembly protein